MTADQRTGTARDFLDGNCYYIAGCDHPDTCDAAGACRDWLHSIMGGGYKGVTFPGDAAPRAADEGAALTQALLDEMRDERQPPSGTERGC